MKDNSLIHPIQLIGNWDEGWALDLHSIRSVPIGEDAFGHMVFDTDRSVIGEQVFLLKNRGQDTVNKILILARFFLDEWPAMETVNMIIPAPPTLKDRAYQPVFEIAGAIAEYYDIPYELNALGKISSDQQKNAPLGQRNIEGKIICNINADKELNILIIDDIYDTGATLNECVRVLRYHPLIKNIFVFTMTKTRG